MIKVGITGNKGFIGSYLYNWLRTKNESIELITFDKDFFENPNRLKEFVNQCDVIVHLAAMNRHPDPQVIYDTNVGLVRTLLIACETSESNPKIIFSSSSQEDRDNLYGRSKKEGRELFEDFAEKNGSGFTSFTIPNVFGPFGKPNYNSFIATFCHKIVHDETPEVFQDAEVGLIYVQELVEIIENEISISDKTIKTLALQPTTYVKVTEVLKKLLYYKQIYLLDGQVPQMEGLFGLQLFNTFRSYIPSSEFLRKFTCHTDSRGAFVEVMRAGVSGQSSFSTTHPGITRGNHYHTRKVERFAVIKGKALIQLRKVGTNEVFEYHLDGEDPAYVDMPIWFTHNIKNIGDGELITLFWINEPYNPADPDTYFEVV